MDVEFRHFRYEFDEATLMKWPSPHFSDNEAGEELRKAVLNGMGMPVFSDRFVFERSHILCANEVFPESAVADPVADLEIWDEWQSGLRAFPYPGKYSRLGITTQESKTSSKTSVGMIGEIFAGIFSQVYLGPWVLVRVIQRWPDFIYYTRDGRYAFVEAKAFTSFNHDASDPRNIPPKVLNKCLVEAARQLNTDPFVKVWLAFTGVMCIDPFRAAVLFIELDTPNRRREKVSERVVPPAVIWGLARRAVIRAASELDPYDVFNLSKPKKGRKGEERSAAEHRLIQRATERIEDELLGAAPEDLIVPARREIERAIKKQARKAYVPETSEARRFEGAKQVAAEGRLGLIRSVGDSNLYLADLPVETRNAMERSWSPDWRHANKAWGTIDRTPLWRGSSAVLALGGRELDGRPIPESEV